MSASLPDWLDPSPWLGLVQHAGRAPARQAAGAESPGIREFAALLSPAAAGEIETLAQRAQALTRRHFGRTISLYAPLYVSNYCPSGSNTSWPNTRPDARRTRTSSATAKSSSRRSSTTP